MRVSKITTALLLAVALLSGCAAPSDRDSNTAWHSLPLKGVSGLAPAGTRWIAVGDAKKKGEPRASLIERTSNGAVRTQPLGWIGQEPVDLEAISAVPGALGRFIAVTSKGEWFAINLKMGFVRVDASGKLPNQKEIDELEGFTLGRIGGRSVAVWGNRGSDSQPGRIFWSEWNGLDRQPFGQVRSANLSLPWPRSDVRHISDLRLTPNGRLWVSSAADPGDKGPFESAVWEAGWLESTSTGLNWFGLARPVQLLRDGPRGHKVEAISVDSSGRLVVASDDEDLGSAIRFSPELRPAG